ncbi:unnamed protein product [Paramecium octaurelia]|uniref:Uncharacterized protein n=1 Tax=Paramecium octaurelia TaxID=43137 RepID=A0A8S1YQB5_PAROT|nr:unnamed protein product [Paramecium octaurelia]
MSDQRLSFVFDCPTHKFLSINNSFGPGSPFQGILPYYVLPGSQPPTAIHLIRYLLYFITLINHIFEQILTKIYCLNMVQTTQKMFQVYQFKKQ